MSGVTGGHWFDDASDDFDEQPAYDKDAGSLADALEVHDIQGGRTGNAYSAMYFDAQPDAGNEEADTLLFTVSNPAGTVTATASLTGIVVQIGLAPKVIELTEAELAEEITVVGALAQQRARAAQHALIVELMASLGRDRVATSAFLEYDLGIPSPASAQAELVEVCATRYPDLHR